LITDEDLIRIGEGSFAPGERGTVDLPLGSLIDYQPVTMSVHVHRGRRPGPCLLLTAGIHGDELIGVETLRRLLKSKYLRSIRGSLIIVPVVCMPAFLSRQRYLPDRRDLNRLFPGNRDGSLGGRLAAVFAEEVVPHADYAIDFHCGALGRPNLPQIRISPGEPRSLELAKAFQPPVIFETSNREGSLRSLFGSLGIPSLLFEGGEAYRLDASAVRFGLRGIVSAMQFLGMLPTPKRGHPPKSTTLLATGTSWLRAPQGGLFTPFVDLGNAVAPGTKLGLLGDPFGRHETPIVCEQEGIVIGMTREASADEGDALFHLATVSNPQRAQAHILRSGELLEEHTAPLQ